MTNPNPERPIEFTRDLPALETLLAPERDPRSGIAARGAAPRSSKHQDGTEQGTRRARAFRTSRVAIAAVAAVAVASVAVASLVARPDGDPLASGSTVPSDVDTSVVPVPVPTTGVGVPEEDPLAGFIGTYQVVSSGFRVDSSVGAPVTIVENGDVVEWHQPFQPNTDMWSEQRPEAGTLSVDSCTARRCEGRLEDLDARFWTVFVDSDGVIRSMDFGTGICGLPDVAGAGVIDVTRDSTGAVASFRYTGATGGGAGGDDGCLVAFMGAYDVVAVRQ